MWSEKSNIFYESIEESKVNKIKNGHKEEFQFFRNTQMEWHKNVNFIPWLWMWRAIKLKNHVRPDVSVTEKSDCGPRLYTNVGNV